MENIKKYINDILDSNAKYNNFLTDKPYSLEFKKLATNWSKLPLYQNKTSISDFFNLLNTKQVILVVSGTGSGKTVLIPKFYLKYLIYMNVNKKIAITNPKIVTTKYNAKYSAQTLDVELGEEVGYKYKGKSMTSDKSKLLYVTDGLILSLISGTDKLLSDYAGVIIDEAHERHIQIDLLIKLLKDIICTNIIDGQNKTILKGDKIEVIKTIINDNKIIIKHKNETYLLIKDNFIYFNYWFEKI